MPAAEESESKGLEDFAALIWNYVNSSEHLVQELDGEVSSSGWGSLACIAGRGKCLADSVPRQDGLKLLRLRTKKQEIVIVPDAKYLLTVVHDTPPA